MDFIDSWVICYTEFGTGFILNQIFTVFKYAYLRRYDTTFRTMG